MTNDFERDVLRRWGKMRRNRKTSSWGLRITGQCPFGHFQMEAAPKQKLNWRLLTSQSFQVEMQDLAPCTSLWAKSTHNTKGLADSGFLHTFEVLPAELAWPQGSCTAVTELCSWILSGPATVLTRHERWDRIFHSSWHVTDPGSTFFSRSSLLQPNQRCLS